MDQLFADAYVRNWLDAWNAHDLDRVLDGFHGDAVFASPLAAKLVPGSGGRLQGREAIRAYWVLGLSHVPDLKFTLLKVFTGVGSLAILTRDHAGKEACEILIFERGLVKEGYGAYAYALA